MADYISVYDLAAWLGITDDNQDNAILANVVTAVSRWVDGFCDRKFDLDTNATARIYSPASCAVVEIDDIGSTSGLVIATGTGDGTYPTVLTGAQYQLRPPNAALATPEAKPYTEVLAVGTAWPWPVSTGRPETVQVTAKWGWPAVPAAVAESCLIQGARVFKRRGSPEGVAGFGEFGVVRVANRLDPDVQQMLAPYRKLTAVG